jgi:hypothetical protein
VLALIRSCLTPRPRRRCTPAWVVLLCGLFPLSSCRPGVASVARRLLT